MANNDSDTALAQQQPLENKENQSTENKENQPDYPAGINPMIFENSHCDAQNSFKQTLNTSDSTFNIMKRSIGKQSADLDSIKKSKTKNSIDKFDNKMASIKKISIDKLEKKFSVNKDEGKMSFGKDILNKENKKQNTPDFSVKKTLEGLDDSINQEIEDRLCKKKVKIEHI